MEHTVNVEMLVKMDKSIYEASPWPNRKDFFQTMIIGHVDTDLNFFKRQAEKLESPTKEEWEIFIKTLEPMKSSIEDTIKYELMNTDHNIEEVKISFAFKYYPTPTMSLEKTVESFIFMTPIQDNYAIVEDIVTTLEAKKEVIEKKITNILFFTSVKNKKNDVMKDIDFGKENSHRQRLENALPMFSHAADFMEEAKASLVIYKDDVVLETPPLPRTNKLGM